MSGGPPGKDLNDSMDSPARPAAPSTSSSSSAPPSGPPEFEQLYDHERYSYSTLDDALQAGRTLAERCGFSLRIKSTARTVVTGVVHKYVCCSRQGSATQSLSARRRREREQKAMERAMVRASRTDRVPDTATEEDEDEDVEGSAISGSLSPRMQQLAATTTMPASPSSIATYPMRASTSQRCGCLWSAKLVGTPIEFGQPGQVWAWSASERAHAHNHEMDEHVELISDDYDEPSANTGAARPRPVVGRAGMSAATAVNGTAVDATSLRISGNLRAPPASDAAPSYLPSAMLLQPQEVNHYPIRPTQFTNDNIHSITTNSHHPIPIINGHPPIIINGSLHHGIDNSAHHHGHHHSIDNRGHHSSISANHHLARPAQLAFQGRRDQAFNNHQPPHFAAHGHAHVAYEHPIIPLPSVTLNAADLYAALALSTARMERLAELRPMLATAKSRSPERHGDERPREP